MPIIFTDNFTDSNGVLLTSHTPDSGGVWAVHPDNTAAGAPEITDANRLRAGHDAFTLVYSPAAPSSADYDVIAIFRYVGAGTVTHYPAIVGRLNTSVRTSVYVELNFDTDTIVLNQAVSGSDTELDTASVTLNPTTDYVVKLEMRGTTVKAYLDGVEVLSATTTVTANGKAGIHYYSGDGSPSNTIGVHFDAFQVAEPDTADVTAPTLSSPTAASTGSTTGSGSVSTDEGNGTLYFVVTTSSSAPSAAQVQAGQDHTGSTAVDSGSQAVSGTGSQSITGGFSGLTASTAYYAHYQHRDAASNDSTVASSSSFTTDAEGGGSGFPPLLVGPGNLIGSGPLVGAGPLFG